MVTQIPQTVFNSQPEFIDSLLKNKEPTLIFNSRNYRPDFRLTLPSLFPLHFPFGHGGIEEDRKTQRIHDWIYQFLVKELQIH